MRNYGFADGDGNAITRGKQFLGDSEARAWAQKEANRRGATVEFWEEEQNNTGETVEPE